MRCIGREVASEALLGSAVEVVVRCDQLLQLGLDVDELGKVVFDERNPGSCEMLHESYFRRLKHEEGFSLSVGAPCRTTNTMDVIAWLVRCIELDNPVNGRDLKKN